METHINKLNAIVQKLLSELETELDGLGVKNAERAASAIYCASLLSTVIIATCCSRLSMSSKGCLYDFVCSLRGHLKEMELIDNLN